MTTQTEVARGVFEAAEREHRTAQEREHALNDAVTYADLARLAIARIPGGDPVLTAVAEGNLAALTAAAKRAKGDTVSAGIIAFGRYTEWENAKGSVDV